MPQRWGKPGSVTTATHTGQPVKFLLRDTWVALGGGSTGGMLKEPLIKGQEQEVIFFSICVYLGYMSLTLLTHISPVLVNTGLRNILKLWHKCWYGPEETDIRLFGQRSEVKVSAT